MFASDVVTLGAALVGLLTSIAGSSACIYNSSRANRINLSILKVKLRSLEILIDSHQQKLNGIDVLNSDDLMYWIKRAREFLSEVDVLDLNNSLNKTCLSGSLPAFWSQFGVAKLVEGKNADADKLLEDEERISQKTKIKGCKQPDVNIVGKAREIIKNKIWKQASDDGGAEIVCIHGVTGVGKTVMAAAIHNKVLVELDSFDNVIWVNIEYGSGLRHVQEEIAHKLDVDLSFAADNVERVETLRRALIQRGKFLLILDSMWQAFPLKDIGIPESLHGSRLIVISRDYSICRKITRKITSKEFYELKPLSDIESWELFTGEIGSNILHLESQTLTMAKTAVRDLDGLPLAINMLAEMLGEIHDDYTNRIDAAWNEELLSITRSSSCLGNKSQELFGYFKYSYENLGEVSFSCFIYCALFPKDQLISAKELIEYWMWEGLLGQFSSIEEGLRKGRKILNELKNAHLLECMNEEGKEELVKMLNLVRHAAIDAISKSGPRFYIKYSHSLTEFPASNEWPAEVERASFMQNQLRAFLNNPDSKKLCTLLLQNNPLDLNHHDHFFSKIRNLKVLNVSYTNISSFPKSFSSLRNLHALLVHNCPNLKQLPSLSNLHKLVALVVSRTPLEQFPEGIHNLPNLRRLDLSYTKLETFRAKVVGKLIQVEELLLITDHENGYAWGSNLINPQHIEACVEELFALKRLNFLQLNFLDAKVYDRYMVNREQNSQPLRSFRFCIGGFLNDSSVGENSIVVIGNYNISLPERTYELYLMSCSQVITSLKFAGCLQYLNSVEVCHFENLMYVFTIEMLSHLRNLKKLSVKQCKSLLGIIQPSTEANPTSITFPELTIFVLFDLPNMESICQVEQLHCPSLRELEVWNCDNLKLPRVLLGRKNGIIEIKGVSKWVENLKAHCPSSNSVIKFKEAPVPAEMYSSKRFSVRRQELVADSLRQNGRLSFGIATAAAQTTGIGALGRIVLKVKGGLAFSQAPGSLHANSTSGTSEEPTEERN